jgi:hypothetical protein
VSPRALEDSVCPRGSNSASSSGPSTSPLDDMSSPYPNDADGDALRNVAESGADMSRPMVIDFSVEVPDELTARRAAEVVAAHGFDPSISEDDDSHSWSVHCSKSMLATYEGVVAVQVELNELLSPHGGICEGWGTFGNT